MCGLSPCVHVQLAIVLRQVTSQRSQRVFRKPNNSNDGMQRYLELSVREGEEENDPGARTI